MNSYIPKLVQRSETHLNKMRFDLFLEWSLKNGFSNIDAQHLATNQNLYNWFNKQLNLLEEEFIRSIANNNIMQKSAMELFSIYLIKIAKIHKIYPKRLLNGIRHNQKMSKTIYSKFNLN